MTDLEGVANRLLDKGLTKSAVVNSLQKEIKAIRNPTSLMTRRLAEAVVFETERSRQIPTHRTLRKLLRYEKSGISMGRMGVGSRGLGDNYIHRLLAKLATSDRLSSILGPRSLDDAGVVSSRGAEAVAVAVDGTHSRLSNFPFLAGFHVTKASLRDIFVKGAIPVAIFDDLHVADDGDVAKLFDFIAGVRTVSQLCQVPLVCGSTLRVGGDMVLGDRMVSSVGAVGVIKRRQWLKARREIKPGDSIIMSEGSGGGTIATTAIYSGNHEAVLQTLNVNTLRLCEHLLNSDCAPLIHAMTDVTNGGIRGDANTICDEAKVGLVFDSSQLEKAVNESIMDLLQKLSIDHLGVSLDSVLVFTPPENENEVLSHIRKIGIKALVVGEVKEHPKKALILMKGKTQALTPKFRESAYTWVKKIVGEENPKDRKKLEKRASAAYLTAATKSNELVTLIRNNTISK